MTVYLLCLLLLLPFLFKRPLHSFGLFTVVFVFLFIQNWGALTFLHHWVIDESQLILQARMIQAGKIPWTHFDPTTSGPLNSLFPNLFNIIFDEANYFSARLVSLFLMSLSLMLVYLGFRKKFTWRVSWLLILPGILLLGLNDIGYLAGYHSGVVPSFLFAVSFYFWICYQETQRRMPLWVALGSAGLQFMAKLQVAPVAFLWSAIIIVKESRSARALRWDLVAALSLPPLIVLLPTVFTSGTEDFFRSYMIAGLSYGKHLFAPSAHVGFFIQPSYFQFFALGMMIVLSFFSSKQPLFLIQSLAACLVLAFSGHILPHYYGIPLIPLLISQGLGIGSFMNRRWLILGYISFLLVLVYLGSPRKVFRDEVPSPHVQVLKDVEDELQLKLKRGDTLSIWGWSPELYLEIGILPQTRDVISQGAMFSWPHQSYYRDRYLEDLRSLRPAYFLEATCLFPTLVNCELNDFVELQSFIYEHYEFIKNYSLPTGKSLKLWKEKSML